MVDPSLLRKYSFFGGIDEGDINKILPRMESAVYAAGETIIVEGTRNDRISFILEGKVAAVKGGIILTELGEGSVFGEMEVMDIMPSSASIKAIVRTKVISVSNKAMHDIYKSDIKIFSMLVMNLARDLSRRLRQMNEKVAHESPFMEWS